MLPRERPDMRESEKTMCEAKAKSDTADKLLRVEELRKGEILDQVSFEMSQGELLAVMGPSGSGKSTLLYQVAGMDQPSGGRVWLGGTEVTGLTEDEKARLRLKRMGFVFPYFQERPLQKFYLGSIRKGSCSCQQVWLALVEQCMVSKLPDAVVYLILCQEQAHKNPDGKIIASAKTKITPH